MCAGDKTAVTHNTSFCRGRNTCSVSETCRIVIVWTAPQQATGSVYFRLTGVIEYNTWYQVQSSPATFQASAPPPPPQQNINSVPRVRNEVIAQPPAQQPPPAIQGLQSQPPAQQPPPAIQGFQPQSPKQCQKDEFEEWCQTTCHFSKCADCCNSWDTCKDHCKTTCC